MAMNTLSKNSISIIVSLLLVIILSETKLFFFFTETYLGRSILILILLFASYLNKILGIVCVFIIIIMFSSKRLINFEGFDNNMTSTTSTGTPGENGSGTYQPTTTTTTSMPGENGSGTYQPTTSMPGANGSGTYQPTTSMPGANGSGTYQPTTTSMPGANGSGTYQPTKINVIAPSSKTTKKPESIEGFDLQSTENNIKRGKQSNSIQVKPSLNSSVDVSPYEGNVHGSYYGEGFSVY
jgi:hypothetical protein